MILYEYDYNYILVEPIKSSIKREIARAYEVLHARLCAHGLNQNFKD